MAARAKAKAEPDVYLSTAEVAAYTGFSPVTLRKWRWQGTGPEFTGRHKNTRYSKAALDEWMRKRGKTP